MLKAAIIIIVLLWTALVVAGIFVAERVYRRVDDLGQRITVEARESKTWARGFDNRITFMLQAADDRSRMTLTRAERNYDLFQGVGLEILDAIEEAKETMLRMLPEGKIEAPEGCELPAPENGQIVLPEPDIADAIRIEDKETVCRALRQLLNLTRAGEDIIAIEYEKVADDPEGFGYEEYAVIHWANGHKQAVTITGDSGKAIIKDVIGWV